MKSKNILALVVFFIFVFCAELLYSQNIKINQPAVLYATPDNELYIAPFINSEAFIYTANTNNYYNLFIRKKDEYGSWQTLNLSNNTITNFSEPQISNNNKFLAFVSTANDIRGNIRIIEFDNNFNKLNEFELTSTESEDFAPIFDYTSEKLLFLSRAKNVPQITQIKEYSLKTRQTKILYSFENIINFTIDRTNNNIAFISKKNNLNTINFLNLKNNNIATLHSSTNELRALQFDANQKILYFNERNSENIYILKMIIYDTFENFKIYDAVISNLSIINPTIKNNKLYFVSLNNSQFDIYYLDGITTIDFAALKKLTSAQVIELVEFSKLDDAVKFYILKNYLLLNAENTNSAELEKFIFRIFDYYNFKRQYRELNELSKFTKNQNFKNLINIMSDYYLKISGLSTNEKIIADDDFLKKLNDLNSAADVDLKIRITEILGDYYSYHRKYIVAVNYYDSAAYFQNSDDTALQSRLLIKKSLIYDQLKESNAFLKISLDIIKKFSQNNLYTDAAIKNIIDYYIKNSSAANRLDIINYFIKLSNDYKPEAPLLSARLLFEAANIANSINENYLAKKLLYQLINDFKFTDLSNDAYIKLGDIYFAEQDYENSFKSYFSAISLNYSDATEERRRLALEKYKQKMFEKGDYEQKIKDYQKAYKTFFKLIEFDKGYVPAYRELIKLGAMLNQLPELENLINSYKTQKLTIVEHSAIEYAEALILTYQKNWKNNLNAALKKVQGAISLKKNVSYYYQLAGWILEQLELQADKYGKYEDSLNNYKIALGLADPENIQNRAELIMNIANVYYHLQNYEFAYRYYAEYEKLSANLKYQDKNILEIFYANYAYSAYVINLYELAEKNYRRAIELTNNAEHKEMYYKKLSLIYYSSARFLEAVQALETANSIAVDTKNLSAAELELRKYYNNRAILLYLMNYLKEHPEISELEKAKLKNKIIELLEKTEQHFNLGFQQLKAKKEGLINLRINIADEGTDNAEGFNPTTEQKFLYMLASGFYQFYNNNQKSIDYLKKRLELLPQKIIIDKMPIAALEQAILLNSIGIEYYRINDWKNSIDYIDSSLNIALQLKDEFGITNNLLCALKILDEQKEKVPLTDFSIKLENYYKNYASSNIANFFSNYRVASAFAYLYYYIYNQMSAAQTKLFNDFEKIQNIEDQIKILKQLKDIYSHQQRALKLLLDLKTKFARQNPNDGLLKIFAEINNANISELTDTRIISNLLDWLNFADINDFEKLCEFENLFLQFNQNTQKYRQYNFVSRQLLNIFYDKLIRSAFDNKDAIKFCLFIDHYQMLINQRLDNFKTINILADEDIYYFQSLLADNQNINIIYYSEYAKKYYACSLNNTDFKLIGVFENLDNLPKSDNLLIVNAAADNFLNANLIIPSIAAYIKSSETRTVFYNKLQKYENINYSNNAIFDTNIDILVFDAAPILSSSQNIGKLKFKDNIELELKAIKEQNPQINYLVLKYGDSYFKNNINNLNHFAEYLIFSGFANILFLNEIDIDKINNNTDISQYLTKGKIYGAGAYSETQRMELARTINEELINNFVEHFQTSNFSTALYYIERIIGLANVLAPSDTELSSYLKLAVDCAYKLQDYKLAAFYQHKILSAGKLDAWQLAQELYKLGIFYANAESYDSSIYYFNQALRYYPDDTKFVSNIKIELSKSNEFKSEYQNAIKYIESAINSTIEFEELGKLYLRLGKIYYLRLNNYILAEEYFYKALDYFKKISDNKNICRALIDIGLVNERLAKFTVSREFYEQALTFARKNNFENMHSEILLNIANTHWFEGNYRNALTYSFNSLDLAKKNNDQMQIYLAMNTIGLIYWSVNDKDKAIYYLENSLALSSALKNYNDVSSTYNNLGIVHRSWKNYPEAEYYFNQALEIDKILKSKWAIGYDYRNLGMLKLAANDLKSAEKFLNDAYQLSVEIKNNINLVKCSLELGNLNLKLAKNKIAFEWFDKTQQQAKEYSMKEIVWRALYGKALAILETDKKQALEYLIEAVEIVENLRADLKIEELTNGFFFDKKDLFDNIIELYVDLQNPQKALEYLERFKSRNFIDLLGNHHINLSDTYANVLYNKVKSLRAELDNFERQMAILEDSQRKKNFNIKIENLKIEINETLTKLKLYNPELESLVSVNAITYDEAKNYIDTDVAFIEYYYSKNKLFYWIITNDTLIFIDKKLASDTHIEKAVADFIRRIQDKAYIEEISNELYELLFSAAEPHIQTKKYIGIIPFEKLHYLSFAALKSKDYYIVDKYNLFYLASLSLSKFVLTQTKNNLLKEDLKILAIGNPDLGDFHYDLPLAELEAQSIQFEFNKVDVLLRKQARKSWVVNNIAKYNVIHIAAHGEFNSINPLFSALKLVEDTDLKLDGDFKALDVFEIKLNADLVTLSACQSGLGKIQAGDEIIGLNRAFFYAGTKSIISSLWRIDDLTTSLLMKHFYRNYLVHNKIESLRNAQLKVKADYPHPMYWSGLFLSGDYK